MTEENKRKKLLRNLGLVLEKLSPEETRILLKLLTELTMYFEERSASRALKLLGAIALIKELIKIPPPEEPRRPKPRKKRGEE